MRGEQIFLDIKGDGREKKIIYKRIVYVGHGNDGLCTKVE